MSTHPSAGDRSIVAVTFDFWNTLVRDTGGIREARLDAAAEALDAVGGRRVDRAELEAAFERAWDAYVADWQANRPTGADHAVRRMIELLEIDDAAGEPLLAVFTDPPSGWHPPLTDNVADCLAELRDAGVAIGIICDVGLTPSTRLRRYLVDHGVLDHFDHWSFSDEVGVFKPDRRIFEHARDGLQEATGRTFEAGEMAHIGDLRRTDVAGARAFGALAVRYSGANDDPGDAEAGTDTVEGDLVVTDHAFLAAALGLAEPRPVTD